MNVSLIRFFPFIFMVIFSIAGLDIINSVDSSVLPDFNERNIFIDFSYCIFLYLLLMSFYLYFTSASYYIDELSPFECKVFKFFEKLKFITFNKLTFGISIVLRVTMLKAFLYLSFFALYYYNKILSNDLGGNDIEVINSTIDYFTTPIIFLVSAELFLGIFSKNNSLFNPVWYISLFIVSAFGLPLFMIHSLDNTAYFITEMIYPSQIRLIISGIVLFVIYAITLICFKENKVTNAIKYFIIPALIAIGLHLALIFYIVSSSLIST